MRQHSQMTHVNFMHDILTGRIFLFICEPKHTFLTTSRDSTWCLLNVIAPLNINPWYHSVQFSCSVVFNSLQLHGLQHTRLPCPSQTPRVCSNPCLSSQWYHPTSIISDPFKHHYLFFYSNCLWCSFHRTSSSLNYIKLTKRYFFQSPLKTLIISLAMITPITAY